MRTPETLTAAQRAERLRDRAPDVDSVPASAATIEAHPVSPKPSSLDKARASLMSSLSQRPSASASLDPRAEIEGSISILSVDDIEFYDHNPRVGVNPKYAEIHESVKADGITNILTVTRRPGGLKYFPYGGGNTRLRIAKELHAQGDSRFAQLRVMIKAWKSEFDVIAAHLVENENRGDTSFWEKALGVSTFRQEYEREYSGHSLIGSDLNRELGKRGMNFGVRMIQNFLFSVEYLAPVGPWLRTQDVNTILRPKLAEYLELASRFDKTEEASEMVRDYLQHVASGLRSLIERNALRDSSEHVAVELDAQRVVQDLASALAGLLGMEFRRFEYLSALLAADPRLQAKDLQALLPQSHYEVAGTVARSPIAGPGQVANPDAPAAQAPDPVPSQEPGPAASLPPVQRSLGPMAIVVGGANSGPSAPTGPSAPLSSHAASSTPDGGACHSAGEHAAAKDQSVVRRRQTLRGQLFATFTEINTHVPIHDFMKGIEEMPFGYLSDLPVQLHEIQGHDVSAHMEDRGMLWHFLAALSGQLHETHWQHAANAPHMAGTRWAQARADGVEPFMQILQPAVYAACGIVEPEQGIFEVHLPSSVLWTLLSDVRLSPLLTRVIQLRFALQQLEPEHHHDRGFQLRFRPVADKGKVGSP
jgi:ParB family protein of integrating conjugative element (PFGI_1 class)